MERLRPEFLEELFKGCLRSKTMFEVCRDHMEYHYLPDDRHKRVWKAMVNHYDTQGVLPTIGILAQAFSTKLDIVDLLHDIRDAEIQDPVSLLKQFESFIRDSMFQELFEDLREAYNDEQKEKAIAILKDKSEKIAEFSLSEQQYDKIFENFKARHRERIFNKENGRDLDKKVPLCVDALNRTTKGGVDKGDIYMYISRSGVGKSKALKSDGVHAARLGYRVVHFQLEGSREECLDAYDACWIGSNVSDIEEGILRKTTIEDLESVSKDIINKGGEIHVVTYEQFNTATLAQIRQSIIDIEKVHGKVDLVLIDYFDKADPGNGKKYGTGTEGEKARRQALGDLMKNIAVELNVAIGTATQASNVSQDDWDSPDFVITRSEIKGDKNQIDPFSYVFSFNQTKKEKDSGKMRIYEDKVRKYSGGRIHRIYTNYDHERFYDRTKTLNVGKHK